MHVLDTYTKDTKTKSKDLFLALFTQRHLLDYLLSQ